MRSERRSGFTLLETLIASVILITTISISLSHLSQALDYAARSKTVITDITSLRNQASVLSIMDLSKLSLEREREKIRFFPELNKNPQLQNIFPGPISIKNFSLFGNTIPETRAFTPDQIFILSPSTSDEDPYTLRILGVGILPTQQGS